MKKSGMVDKLKQKLAQAGDAIAEILAPQPRPEFAPIRVKANRNRRR